MRKGHRLDLLKTCVLATLVSLGCASLGAQKKPAVAALAGQTMAERRTEAALAVARKNPVALRIFLFAMPKGADLHNHLSGAVYAESFIRAAVEDKLCVDPASDSFAKAQVVPLSPQALPVCANGKVPAAQALTDQHLYDALVNAFSMRSFVPSAGLSGHDHFFDTFAKFSGTDVLHTGEWLDEVATRAAAQNEQYLELMATPTSPSLDFKKIVWTDDFGKLRQDLFAKGLRNDILAGHDYWNEAEARRRLLEHCGLPFEPGCLNFHETRRSVRTASAEQVRQPLYTSGVGHWRHFEKELEPLRRALGDCLERFE